MSILKRFFIATLGTITGIWITILMLFIAIIFLVVGMAGKSSIKTVNDNSVLHIKLSGAIAERYTSPSIQEIISDGGLNENPTLSDIITALDRAAEDKNIKGVYLECGGAALGIASREELIEAIGRFRKSGKKVVAYADAYTQLDYLVASAADQVLLNPVGHVDIHGIGMTVPFFKGLLDKLGVEVQVIKVGSFKSAVEPYIMTEMSDSARLQSTIMVDSLWSYYSATLAANRSLAPSVPNMLADSLSMSWSPTQLADNKVITATAYGRNVKTELCKAMGIKDKDDLNLVTPAEYLQSDRVELHKPSEKHIAVVYAVGDIVDEGNEGKEIVGSKMVELIQRLADDDKVAGMVLRVNSPGGSAFASEQIWEATEYFKSKKKPVYVSMGDYAASGGYYISCNADYIYADATTLTGSIGVFGMIPNFGGTLTDKLGISFSRVNSGPNAQFISVTEPMTPEQKDAMQRNVENTYDLFTSRVAAGRKMEQARVKQIGEGRVWIGSYAIKIGLVDAIGSLHTAINALAKKAGVAPTAYVNYPEDTSSFLREFMAATASDGIKGISLDQLQLDAKTVEHLMFINRLRTMNPIQARMPAVEME
ncbi:MAG: signal peptide peptidase SppA [Muribaculaceae bacterium]|nr:signal peptide peptidase SppA [Muribaculaceae bacterium]